MSETNNMHAGHRERMLNKIAVNPDALADHELLEILLYNTLSRVDTNPLAHKLLDTFGSLDKVFSASVEELMLVKGVGRRTAGHIKVCGAIFERAMKAKSCERIFTLNPNAFINYFNEKLKPLQTEQLVILMLGSRHQVVAELAYDEGLHTEVNGDIGEIAKALSLHNPKHVVFAHNHPNGNCNPSHNDDVATAKLVLLAMAHGAIVLDHVVVGKDGYYSYHMDGNLDKIRQTFRTDSVMNKM